MEQALATLEPSHTPGAPKANGAVLPAAAPSVPSGPSAPPAANTSFQPSGIGNTIASAAKSAADLLVAARSKLETGYRDYFGDDLWEMVQHKTDPARIGEVSKGQLQDPVKAEDIEGLIQFITELKASTKPPITHEQAKAILALCLKDGGFATTEMSLFRENLVGKDWDYIKKFLIEERGYLIANLYDSGKFTAEFVALFGQETIDDLTNKRKEYSASLDDLFEGDENSLVARAVGAAEGTRYPKGGKTSAYNHHIDPGNGANNLGTFSYQHGAASPAEADRKQLARLRQQAEELLSQASARGLTLTAEETLAGIDLLNQAPETALGKRNNPGYIEGLVNAKKAGFEGSDAILQARVKAFIKRDGRWDAPGLGNDVKRVTGDQRRRMNMVREAMAV